MGSARLGPSRVGSRQRWLGLSFLGVWVYLAAQLLQLYPVSFADRAALSLTDANLLLRIMSNLGQVLFFVGIVATLSRANRSVGVSRAGVQGLVAGSLGIGMLVVLECLLVFQWYRIPLGSLAGIAEFYPVGSILGVALALAGIASLAVGLTRRARPFGKSVDAASAPSSHSEKPI